MINKKARFAPFWILLGVLGILLLGSFIPVFQISLDDVFSNIQDSADANGQPELSCTSSEASGIMKATCFTLGGFLFMFIVYSLFYWISGMVAGAKAKGPVFSPKYREAQAALES